jgi:hypothetical protein
LNNLIVVIDKYPVYIEWLRLVLEQAGFNVFSIFTKQTLDSGDLSWIGLQDTATFTLLHDSLSVSEKIRQLNPSMVLSARYLTRTGFDPFGLVSIIDIIENCPNTKFVCTSNTVIHPPFVATFSCKDDLGKFGSPEIRGLAVAQLAELIAEVLNK